MSCNAEDERIDCTPTDLESNVIYKEEESPQVTHTGLEPPHTTLHTIQEDKELSLCSDESSEDIICDKNDIKATEVDSSKTSEVVRDVDEEKKINLHWINEDDEDDDLHENEGVNKSEFIHPDVDRGWAWVVLFATFCIFCLEAGLLASTGLYYVQMLKEFGHSRSYTAWMGSLVNAFYMLTGPLSSVFIKYTSSRAAILFGAVLAMVGYVMSAFAESLAFVFFSYGVVVAVGMNFVYSGQIIALAQYFSKFHSLATSAAMVGIGIGMFSVIRLLDLVIAELGWRNSFIICGAMALQCSVFGFLVFPLKVPLKEIIGRENDDDINKMFSQEEISSLLYTPVGKKLVNERSLSMNRSVSSLRLSVGAGYLSSSLVSLNNDSKHSIIRSNQHSFYSRDIGSNQPSFLHLQNSHSELATGLPSLKSNQHSFCSRGSFYGVYSLKSNPQSFSVKNSQMDLHQPLHPQVAQLRDEGHDLQGKKGVILQRSQSRISNIRSLKECQNSISEEVPDANKRKCCLFLTKLKNVLGGSIRSADLFVDPSFWFLFISIFFTMFATIKLFIIYKDLSAALGFGDYYSLAMTSIGIGDIVGRVSGGILASTKWANPILCYSIAMVTCGLTIGLKLYVNSGPLFLVVTTFFGITFGLQNVLLTIAPMVIFGRDKLVTVFGYILFAAGLGALIGAPIAGCIVDRTQSFEGVIALSVGSCFVGGFFMFLCFLIGRRREKLRLMATVSV